MAEPGPKKFRVNPYGDGWGGISGAEIMMAKIKEKMEKEKEKEKDHQEKEHGKDPELPQQLPQNHPSDYEPDTSDEEEEEKETEKEAQLRMRAFEEQLRALQVPAAGEAVGLWGHALAPGRPLNQLLPSVEGLQHHVGSRVELQGMLGVPGLLVGSAQGVRPQPRIGHPGASPHLSQEQKKEKELKEYQEEETDEEEELVRKARKESEKESEKEKDQEKKNSYEEAWKQELDKVREKEKVPVSVPSRSVGSEVPVAPLRMRMASNDFDVVEVGDRIFYRMMGSKLYFATDIQPSVHSLLLAQKMLNLAVINALNQSP
jgi:hypothetical protein